MDGTATRRSKALRYRLLITVLASWTVLTSAAGIVGTGLNLDGPPHPATTADLAYVVTFLLSVGIALPFGAVLRSYRLVELLCVAGAMTVLQEFWYGAIMSTSPYSNWDAAAAAGGMLMLVPLYGLLFGLLAAGLGIGRVVMKRQRR